MKFYYGLATRWWKKFEDIFIRFGATHERDGRTDRHRVTAKTALMHCIGNKWMNLTDRAGPREINFYDQVADSEVIGVQLSY